MRRSGVAASSCLCGLDEGANETMSAGVGSEHAVDSRGRGRTAQLTYRLGLGARAFIVASRDDGETVSKQNGGDFWKLAKIQTGKDDRCTCP